MTEKNKTISYEFNMPEITDQKDRQLVDRMFEKSGDVYFDKGRPKSRKKKFPGYEAACLANYLNVTDPNSAMDLVHTAAIARNDKNTIGLDVALSMIRDLDPSTALESMLASQMVAVNASISKLMKVAMVEDQYPESTERNLNLATKLQRTFLQQIDALQKLKGKCQQTVTVKHVTVNEGGQAIVGNIAQKTIGRG